MSKQVSRAGLSFAFAALAALAFAGVATAAPHHDLARKKAHDAAAAYDLGQYAEAARLYEESYKAVQDPSLLFNIGQAYRMAGQPDSALTAYRSFLRKAPADSPVRAQVEGRVAELEKIVADTRQSQNAPPPQVLPANNDGAGDSEEARPDAPAATASAAPGARRDRTGWNFSIGLNAGSLRADCSECGNAAAAGGLHGSIGWMFRPRLAFVFDVWGMAHTESYLTVYQTLAVAAAKFWVTPTIWLMGGFGFATAGYNWAGILMARADESQQKPGIMGGAGWEFYDTGKMIIDAQVRFGTGFYSDTAFANGDKFKAHSFSIGVALNWY